MVKVVLRKVAKQICFNRIVIFPTGGGFLRKLLEVHSSCVCVGFILDRQRLKLNWSENVPAYTGYITMRSNSFSCFRGETTDGRTHRRTDRQTKHSIMRLIHFVCVHRHQIKLNWDTLSWCISKEVNKRIFNHRSIWTAFLLLRVLHISAYSIAIVRHRPKRGERNTYVQQIVNQSDRHLNHAVFQYIFCH